MRKDKKLLLFLIILGTFCIIGSLIFRIFLIEPYRNLLKELNLHENWNYHLVSFLILNGMAWIGLELITIGVLLIILIKINPNILNQETSKKKKRYFLLSLFLLIWLNTFYILVSPPFWMNILILSIYIFILIIFEANRANKLPKRFENLKRKLNLEHFKKKKNKIIISLLFASFSLYLFVPSPIQPGNLPNVVGDYYIQDGRLYNVNTSAELRLMGWDYHWVAFSGPGEAWDATAKIVRFNLTTIRQDLIWASQAGNFIRICANWFEIEEVRGVYNYSVLDHVFNVIENDPEVQELFVLLEIGPIKTSKVWVQASLPEWFPYRFDLQDPVFIDMVKPFISKTVERYKNRTSLFAYQLENEPDFLSFTFTDPDEDYIITGDVPLYMSWLNDLVKSYDPNHFTAVNYFVNNLYAQQMLAPVDLILYDYYGSIENTAPLQEYAIQQSQYLPGKKGFGVAELQLNKWHYEITDAILEQEYQAVIDSGMTLILWSELHDPNWWDESAISPDNIRTHKYYKVQELFTRFKSAQIPVFPIRISFIWINVLMFNLSMISMVLAYIVLLKMMGKKILDKEKRVAILNLLITLIFLPTIILSQCFLSNHLFLLILVLIMNLTLGTIIVGKGFSRQGIDEKTKSIRIKTLIIQILVSGTLLLFTLLFYY